jgi:hypothetical protein
MTHDERNTVVAARGPTKKDVQADFQERVLAVNLANRATYMQWFTEMIKVTPPKRDKATGGAKAGIGETTFRRQLRVIVVERRHAINVGGFYSIVAGRWAQPDSAATDITATLGDGERTGGGSSGSHFSNSQLPPISSQTRTEEKDRPAAAPSGDDLVTQALGHARLRELPR